MNSPAWKTGSYRMEDEAKIDDEDRTRGAKWYKVTRAKEEVSKGRDQDHVQNRYRD